MALYSRSFSPKQIADLIDEVKDYQLTHGSLIKLVRFEDEHTVPARPIGASLFPTPFPRPLFQKALALAPIFNKLYSAVSEDDAWIYDTLKDLVKSNPFIGTLWDIHQIAKHDGFPQSHVLGIFRSDYMLHCGPGEPLSAAKLKQVEINTYSCAGGTHGSIVADVHRHLARKGAYGPQFLPLTSMPRNDTVRSIVEALCQADKVYRTTHGSKGPTCVLFVVQPLNINICDERPLEYALWETETPAYRVTFGQDVLDSCRLGNNGELSFTSSTIAAASEIEVSVVYFRAGYDANEYDAVGKASRLLFERCRAIKCPSIACHLMTLKKIQQALTTPSNLSRFLPKDEANLVAPVFMSLYLLDQSTGGLKGRDLALNPQTAIDYVLKPSLEGGGHNVYRDAIPSYMERLTSDEMKEYILMEMMNPPEITNTLISWAGGLHDGPVTSELGIFGACLWSKKESKDGNDQGNGKVVFESNETAGWSFKTKATSIDEMSVVKGYGCFDSPLLVDDKDSV